MLLLPFKQGVQTNSDVQWSTYSLTQLPSSPTPPKGRTQKCYFIAIRTQSHLRQPPPQLPTADSTKPQPFGTSFDFITTATGGVVSLIKQRQRESSHPGKRRNELQSLCEFCLKGKDVSLHTSVSLVHTWKQRELPPQQTDVQKILNKCLHLI